MAHVIPNSNEEIDEAIDRALNPDYIIVTTGDSYATVDAYVVNHENVVFSDGNGGIYLYAGSFNGNHYFSRVAQGSDDTSDAVYEVAFVDSGDNWSVGGGSPIAPLFNPTFTGNPKAPTPPVSSDNTRIATTEFVHDAVDPIAEAVNAAYVTDTAEGDIASFPDGADNIPVKDLTAQIVPVQDLHGYDYPWPAGGGKNKIPYPYYSSDGTYAGIPITTDADGRIKGSGTSNASFYYNLTGINFALSAGTYTLSVKGDHTGPAIRLRDMSTSTNITTIANGATDDSATFTLESDMSELRLDLMRSTTGQTFSLNCTIQLESGSSPTAFAPYSNISPISGYTGATIKRTGANLLNANNAPATVNYGVTYTPQADGSVVVSGTKNNSGAGGYALNAQTNIMNLPKGVTLHALLEDSTYHGLQIYVDGVSLNNGKDYTFTIPEDATSCYARLRVSGYYNTDISETVYPMIVVDGVDAPFAPFSGQTYTIDWTDEAGTVYGGTLDVTTGVLTAKKKPPVTINDISWNYSNNLHFFFAEIADMAIGEELMCDCYKYIGAQTDAQMSTADDCTIAIGPSAAYIKIKDTRYTTVSAFKEAMGAHEISYTLATPIVVQLSPTEVKTLLGANNIWADTGEVEVEYRADTKLYIAKVLA